MPKINIRTVDLNLLRVYLSIWETRNLTVSGDQLALTQPAVSHALKRLRDLFNDPLFVRTPDGMQPTEAAIRLHDPIDEAIFLINRTLQLHTGFDCTTAVRTFKISMSDMCEFFFLPPLLSALEALAPHISFEIIQAPLPILESGMRSGDIDLAIGYVPNLTSECQSHTLFQDQHVCMVRSGHPLIERTISKSILGKLRYIFANSNATGHHYIEQWLNEQQIKRNIVLHLPHFTVAPEIVGSTDLAVIFPRSIAERFNRQNLYKLLPLPFEFPAIDVKLHWHQRFSSDEGIAWLRGVFIDMFFEKSPAWKIN